MQPLPPSERGVERQLLQELLDLKHRGLTTRAPDILPAEAGRLDGDNHRMGLSGGWSLSIVGGDTTSNSANMVVKIRLHLGSQTPWEVELKVVPEWEIEPKKSPARPGV